jgi:mannose-6-phosphate isomerase-like protein (cupin superfamily)
MGGREERRGEQVHVEPTGRARYVKLPWALGVNLIRLRPGAQSALHHRHSRQDEFVLVLEGDPTLAADAGEEVLGAGMCAGVAG